VCAATVIIVSFPLVAALKDPWLVLLIAPAIAVVVAATGFLNRWLGLLVAVLVIGALTVTATAPNSRIVVLAIVSLIVLVTWGVTAELMGRWPALAAVGPLVLLGMDLLVGDLDSVTTVIVAMLYVGLSATLLAILALPRGAQANTGRGWALVIVAVVAVSLVSGVVATILRPFASNSAHLQLEVTTPDGGNSIPQDIPNPLQRATLWQLGLVNPDGLLMSLLPPVQSVRPVWVSLQTYTGRAWLPPEVFDVAGDDVPTDPSSGTVRAIPRGMNVRLALGFPGAWVPVPQRVKGVRGDNPLRANVATGTVASFTQPADHTFFVNFATPIATQAELFNATPGFATGVDPATALPGPLPEHMADLARSVERIAGPLPFPRVLLLAQRLRKAPFEVAPATDLGPTSEIGRDLDALDRVLVDHVGFQEQYAAIWALIARSWGIPTELSIGFLPKIDPLGTAVHPQDVSIWGSARFANIGWVAFQPSPQDRLAGRPIVIRPYDPTHPPPGPTPTPEPIPTPTPEPTPNDNTITPQSLEWAAIALGGSLVLVVVCWVLVVRIVRLRRRRSCQRGDARRRVIGAWRWMRVILAEARMPLPESRPPGVLISGDLPETESRYVEELSHFVLPALYSSDHVDDGAALEAWNCLSRLEKALAIRAPRVRIKRWMRLVRRPWSRQQLRSPEPPPDATTASRESTHPR
jgi:hypothetical protein